MQAEGYIYILFNPAYRANQYKIGMTTKTPERRATEISASTGVPHPFEVLYERRVVDCQKAERLVHQRLAAWRGSTDREFFVLPLKDAVGALNDIAAEVGLLEEDKHSTATGDPVVATEPVAGEVDLTPHLTAARRTSKMGAQAKSAPITAVNFEDHIAYTDVIRQPILRQLRQDIIAMDDRLAAGESVTLARRIRYKIPGGKIFIEIKVQRSAVLVRLTETPVADTSGVVRKIPESHGWGDLKDEFRLTSVSEVEYVLQFVRAAYQIAVSR